MTRPLLILTTLSLALPLVACDAGTGGSETTSTTPEVAVDPSGHEAEAAPETLPVFNVAAAEALITGAAQQGQVLVLDYWGTWCGPCIELFPGLHEALVDLGPGVRPATVAWMINNELPDVLAFLGEHHAYKDAYVLSNDEANDVYTRTSDRLKQPGTPVSYPIVIVYDTQGQIAAEFHGGDGTIDPAEVAATAEALMAGAQ